MKTFWRNFFIFVAVLGVALLAFFLWLNAGSGAEPEFEGKQLSAWIEQTRTGDMLAQDHARQVVAQIGLPALPELISQIEQTPNLRERIGERLRKHLPAAARRFLPGTEKNRTRRLQAMQVIHMIGPAASNAIPAIVQAFRERDVAILSAARATLARLGPVAVPALIALLEDQSFLYRSEAAFALMDIGPPAQAAIPALQAAIKNGNPDTARASVYALGRLGEAAIPALAEALNDPRPETRKIAQEELTRLSPKFPAADVMLKQNANGAAAPIGN